MTNQPIRKLLLKNIVLTFLITAIFSMIIVQIFFSTSGYQISDFKITREILIKRKDHMILIVFMQSLVLVVLSSSSLLNLFSCIRNRLSYQVLSFFVLPTLFILYVSIQILQRFYKTDLYFLCTAIIFLIVQSYFFAAFQKSMNKFV